MQHLDALRQVYQVQPIAIPCRPERRRELEAEGYIVAADLKEAVNNWNVSHCVVATNTSRHVRDSLAAMESGLDTLVEKPMGIDASEAKRLCAEARRVDRKVYVGCVLRFSESLKTFRAWLNRIEPVHSVRIECQTYLPDWRPARGYRDVYSARVEEGGVLRDLVHEIDYAGWLFGWPATIQARVRSLGRLGIEADEEADLMWEAADASLVTVRLDYLSRPPRRQMRACGKGGTVEWDGIANRVVLALATKPAEIFVSTQTRQDMMRAQAKAFIHDGHATEVGQLATCVEGAKALAICDAARRATKSTHMESVDYE